jgi:hypothetical protein
VSLRGHRLVRAPRRITGSPEATSGPA